MLWSLDERRDDALVIGFPYFEHEAPCSLWPAAAYLLYRGDDRCGASVDVV